MIMVENIFHLDPAEKTQLFYKSNVSVLHRWLKIKSY